MLHTVLPPFPLLSCTHFSFFPGSQLDVAKQVLCMTGSYVVTSDLQCSVVKLLSLVYFTSHIVISQATLIEAHMLTQIYQLLNMQDI